MKSRLGKCYNIEDLRKLARRKLPGPMFHYIDGGAEDEVSMAANQSDFERIGLVPRYAVDVSEISTSTRILGCETSMPLILSPTGMTRLFHPDGELAVSKAASDAGLTYSLSTMGSTSIEEIGRQNQGSKCFQIYAFRDRELTGEFIDRARQAGFTSLCLTVDVPVAGNRERDLRTGMTLPPKLGLMALGDIAAHPLWCWNHLTSPSLKLANVSHRVAEANQNISTLSTYITNQFDPGIGWSDVEWIASRWGGPLAIKGILHPEDAKNAVDSGASAIWVSNHGGRQLDGAVSPIKALPKIADAVADKAEIILDSGIRRGSHMVKAMAMGADACAIGRPYLFGLSVAGESGVRHTIEILRTELQRAMALTGATSIESIAEADLREDND